MPTTLNYMGIVHLMHQWSCKKKCQSVLMKANQMKLNSSKTEVVWFSTCRSLYKLPTQPVCVLNDHIIPSDSVTNLGDYFDKDLSIILEFFFLKYFFLENQISGKIEGVIEKNDWVCVD